MKRAAMLLFLAACASTSEVPLDTAFSLRHGQTTAVSGAGFDLTFAGVSDSRCPRNAVCVWEGEVTVTLRAGEEELSVKVPGGAVVGVHEIEVREVNPYPDHPPPKKSAYTATIVVRRAAVR